MNAPPQHIDSKSPKRRSRMPLGFPLLSAILLAVMLTPLVVLCSAPTTARRVAIARRKETVAEISSLCSAVEHFKIDVGRYPTEAEGLGALVKRPAGATTWASPYIVEVPMDKWGHAYRFVCPVDGDPKKFDIISAGSDGVFGTADDITRATR